MQGGEREYTDLTLSIREGKAMGNYCTTVQFREAKEGVEAERIKESIVYVVFALHIF
jgi:hypothetical protein